MPRPRKPVELHELNGAYKKNPNRRLPPPPKSNHPIGDPPEWLTKPEAEVWQTLTFEIPDGVLTAADRQIVGMACQLLAKAHKNQINGIERNQLIAILARLGMTPADRSRITPASPGRKDDEFSEFA